MESYKFSLTAANKDCSLNFKEIENQNEIFSTAVINCNNGVSYTRYGKQLVLDNITPSEIFLTLISRSTLSMSTRSLSSGFSRELLRLNKELFKEAIYNKTLFRINLIEKKDLSQINPDMIPDTDTVKILVDLLFAHTNLTKKEAEERENTIRQIKLLLLPYSKKTL